MPDRYVLITVLPHVSLMLASFACAATHTLEALGWRWALTHAVLAASALSYTAMEDLVELAHRRHRFPAWPEQPREEPPC